jgi:phage protein D
MQHDNLRIEIDGVEAEDLYADLSKLEVELDDQLAGMFRLTVALLPDAEGSWPYLDDERFTIWRRVVVTAGLEDDSRQLLAGYVTHVRPDFGAGTDQCQLEVWGMDASVLMDREVKLKDWPNKKDSDIAAETFQAYGLTPRVTDTEVVHDEEVSTIIQRETDIQFLKRLALRNGYECFVDGDTGYFQPPSAAGAPQPVLTVRSGAEATLNRLAITVNALAPANVAMSQVDRVNKEILDATADETRQQVLGANPPGGFLPAGMSAGVFYVGQTVTTGTAEMAALCQGLHEEGEWFVTAEGEVAANQYGNILTPRGTVLIAGVGETYSGTYYVSHVTHAFTADGYTQQFKVKRNALVATGPEGLSGDGGRLL